MRNLPKLPGYTFYDPRKSDYRKPQICTVTAGLMGARPPRPDDLETSVALRSANISTRAPPREPVSTFPDYIPAHVAFEHLVLRFFAYFRETIPESADENFRVRYVKIHVYLEDDTVMIEENHVRNSGMPQGVILRRMRVINPNIPEPSGTLYTVSDFDVGINMEIFGIVYHIYACDKFTDDYFHSINRPLSEFEEPPDDLYSIKRKITERPIRVSYINTDKTNLKRFLDFDGKVLRFYATWDDRRSLFGEKRKFIIHFFLVDGTIEIRQVLPLNSGRDPVSQFLKKTLLQKPGSSEYYTDSDLYIGQRIDVFNRSFILYDADEFTKEFLDKKYGPHDWTPFVPDGFGTSAQKTEKVLPPYNGWGNEEDSVGYCVSLHPKPPRKDIVKFISKDGMLLRFEAKLKDPQPQDAKRIFVIVYYLADDTVAVFELPERNSGFRGGKFVQREKLKNVNAGNRYFEASDFKVGEEITINSFTFITFEADEYALNYMESLSDEFPQSDLFEIIMYMKKRQDIIDALRKEFELYDPDLHGYVSQSEAEKSILKYYKEFQAHEARTVCRRWLDENGFDYFGFVSALR